MRLLALVLVAAAAWAQAPRLLLTSQQLKRIQKDRDRQTERWVNFERRVQTVTDSPERGFELALYSLAAADDKAKKEAIEWAASHPCQRRQTALIVNWFGDLPPDLIRQLETASCPDEGNQWEQMRNKVFWTIATGGEPDAPAEIANITTVPEAPGLYALAEILNAFKTAEFTDVRRQNLSFYSSLPAAYLLSLRPEQVSHPTGQQHIAALAVVAVDPNLESSQFLQGWAMEEQYMVREGPGLAYELLWANPYLPGIGYQNMEPWLYRTEAGGRLLARTSWQPDACWVSIRPDAVEQENCPAGWRSKPLTFSRLELIPLDGECVHIDTTKRERTSLLHSEQPNVNLHYASNKNRPVGKTDAAGLWLVPNDQSGTICQERRETTHARGH